MTKYWLLLFGVLLISEIHAQSSQEQAPNFSLKGTVTNRDTGFMYLKYSDITGKLIQSSTRVTNGSFTFAGTINQPALGIISNHIIKVIDNKDPNLLPIFLEPVKMTINLTVDDFHAAELIGSSTQTDRNILNKQIENKVNLNDSEVFNKSNVDSLKEKSYWTKQDIGSYQDPIKTIELTYADQNTQSYLSPYLVRSYLIQRLLSNDSAEVLYNHFTPSVKNSNYGTLLNTLIENAKPSLPGAQAPLFVKKDINGNDVNLTFFKGKKYILLDFWASWCEPCREMTAMIKELYKKYHNSGLEIISISWDDNEKAWKDAISKDGIGMWYNVIASLGGPDDNSMKRKYNIPFIPTLILIEKNGTIVGRYDNGDDDHLRLEKDLQSISNIKVVD